MARKKGREVNGWLIVDKPAGVTSTSVVAKVRWALDAKKAGHAGTLDPDATGVLAVALGEATKTVPVITDALKCYDFVVNWGSETATDDASGDVVKTADARPTRAEVQDALGQGGLARVDVRANADVPQFAGGGRAVAGVARGMVGDVHGCGRILAPGAPRSPHATRSLS